MNKYMEDAYIKEISTIATEVRVVKKKPAIALEENIFYPGGGGQPYDIGSIELSNGKIVAVNRTLKLEGKIFICLSENIEIKPKDPVIATIDWNRRYRFMRYHTAAHVLMGAVKKNISNYAPEGIEISENGSSCQIAFSGSWDKSQSAVKKIFDEANNVISKDYLVEKKSFPSLLDAMTAYQSIYRGDDNFTGSVRLIVIQEWDANPCGGTHIRSLSEVGSIKFSKYDPNKIIFTLERD